MFPKNSLSISIGQALRTAREEASLTQQEVAARASMDRSYISDVERGETMLSMDRFFKICVALEVKPSDLVRRIEKLLEQHSGTPKTTRQNKSR